MACHCFKLANNFPLLKIQTPHHCLGGPTEMDSCLPLLAHLSPCEEQAACWVHWCDPKGHHLALKVFLHWYQKTGYVPGIYFEQKNEAMNTWLMRGWAVIQLPQITPPRSGFLLGHALSRKREQYLFRLMPKPQRPQAIGQGGGRAFNALTGQPENFESTGIRLGAEPSREYASWVGRVRVVGSFHSHTAYTLSPGLQFNYLKFCGKEKITWMAQRGLRELIAWAILRRKIGELPLYGFFSNGPREQHSSG